jgi:hypothetical protein
MRGPEDLWTPSDALLAADPIALEHVRHPHARSGAIDVMALPDIVDEKLNAAAADAVLAEIDDDDVSNGEDGRRGDDGDVDPDDAGGDLDPGL